MPSPDDLVPGPNVVYERHPGAASALLPPASSYRPRRPQDQPLYRIVSEHLETFLAEPLAHGASPYRQECLLDVRLVTDDDIAKHTGIAGKIGAETDPAREIPLGRKSS